MASRDSDIFQSTFTRATRSSLDVELLMSSSGERRIFRAVPRPKEKSLA